MHHLRIAGQTTRRLCTNASPPGVKVAIPEVRDFIMRCMQAVKTKRNHAQALADNLTMADYRGHFSHGLNRLGNYSSPDNIIGQGVQLQHFYRLYAPPML
jgi:hypothetical protein